MLHGVADQGGEARERQRRSESEYSDVGVLLEEAEDLIRVAGASRDVQPHSPLGVAAGGVDVRRAVGGGEIEIGEGIPEFSPAAGENARLRGGFDREEGDDVVEDVVGEIADAILIVEVGRRRILARLLPLGGSRFHESFVSFAVRLLVEDL